MSSGIAGNALRRQRWALAGPMATQLLAAAVMALEINLLTSLHRSLSPAQRAVPAVTEVIEFTIVMIGDTVYLSIAVIGATMNLAAGLQLRDLALLRTIGASPGQVRRALVTLALATAVPAALVGSAAAVPGAWAWLHLARSHGAVPPTTRLTLSGWSLAAALAVVLITSVLGTLIGVMRLSRRSPASAVVDVWGGRQVRSRVRTGLGLLLVAAGAVLSIVLAVAAPSQTGDAVLLVMLAQCLGVGLLGPVVLRRITSLLRPLVGRGLARLAVDDLATLGRSLSAALVPSILAASFSLIMVASHLASPPGAPVGPAGETFTDAWGTGLIVSFATVAAGACFVTVVITRRHTLAAMQLIGASRSSLVVMAAIEAAIVSAVILGAAAAIAGFTVGPIVVQAGLWPIEVPAATAGAFGAAVATVVGLAMVGPTVWCTAVPAIRAAGTAT